jgi:hypothetical protein
MNTICDMYPKFEDSFFFDDNDALLEDFDVESSVADSSENSGDSDFTAESSLSGRIFK